MTTTYQIGNASARLHTSKARLTSIDLTGLQQLTIDQLKQTVTEIDLCIELFREEARLHSNRTASDQGAYEGVNGT